MAEFRGIHTSLFLMLLLQFTGAAAEESYLYLDIRDGDEATLSCISVRDGQNNCDTTTWIYSYSSGRKTSVYLVRGGQIIEHKSNRLSLTETCSLVIKKVTKEDGGYYDCRQIRSGEEEDTSVLLSVVTMTDQKDSDEATLTCSVSIYYRCLHSVKWLFEGQDVDKDNREIKTSQSDCSASVTFRTSHYIHTSRSLMCEVTDGKTGEVHQFPFSRRPPGEDTTTEPAATSGSSTEAGNTTTASGVNDASTPPPSTSWRSIFMSIFVSVGLAALIITVVAINVWTRIKEKKTQTDEITVRYDAGDDTVNYENITSPDGV